MTPGTDLSQLAIVLEEEHCGACTYQSCDIYVAWKHGLYLWAAWALQSATDECRETEAIYRRLGVTESELEADRVALLAIPHRECAKCGSLSWLDVEGVRCDQCGETFTEET